MPVAELRKLHYSNVPRFISDLLTSSDFVIISGALCMADVLMTKMSDTFCSSFVREGVVHEAEKFTRDERLQSLVRAGV